MWSHSTKPAINSARQFKAETVALIRSSGKSVPQVCRDLDLAESVVRRPSRDRVRRIHFSP
jgi:transposase-like protein